MQDKKIGFTLAEVLIALGIIGTVAVMTIPTLVNKANNVELNTAWKKSYSILSQAVLQMSNDNGGSLKGIFTDSNAMRTMFKSYLNYIKECDSTNILGNCWPSNSRNLANTDSADFGGGIGGGLVLKDGQFLSFVIYPSPDGTNCSYARPGFSVCGYIVVDVNGMKQPNTMGKDIFYLYVLENSTKPLGVTGDYTDFLTDCNPSQWGYGCSAKYLYQ